MYAGVLLILLGICVRFLKWSWLIAGYNTLSKEKKAEYDEIGLCKFVGNLLFVLAVFALIGDYGISINLSWVSSTSYIAFFITTISAVIYMNTGSRYRKKV